MGVAPHEPKRGLVVAVLLSLLLLPVAVLLDPNIQTWRLLILLVLGSLTGLTRVTLRWMQVFTACVAILIGVFTLTPALGPVVNALNVAEQPRQANVIVILGGGANCGTGEPESSSLARLVRGLELWRAGYANTITLTGTQSTVYGGTCPSLETMTQPIINRLYPNAKPRIVILQDMQTTRTEAEAVAREAQARGWQRIMVVTSPVHTLRARGTFRGVGLDAFAVASQEPEFDMTLPKPSDRWAALQPVAREILGLITYQLRGWLR